MRYDAGGTTIKHIYITKVVKMPIAVPPLGEQIAISSYCRMQRSRLDALIENVEKGIGVLREYRTALVSAAVTGKIDVRGEAVDGED
jgi:type I restriction enzyme S subunit